MQFRLKIVLKSNHFEEKNRNDHFRSFRFGKFQNIFLLLSFWEILTVVSKSFHFLNKTIVFRVFKRKTISIAFSFSKRFLFSVLKRKSIFFRFPLQKKNTIILSGSSRQFQDENIYVITISI